MFGFPGYAFGTGGGTRMAMDFLTGAPKRMVPPSTPHAPSRGSVSGVVNIHNPQLNSAADIDRLADAVAKAQARALRSSGYVRK
jgi:hypothetical protein